MTPDPERRPGRLPWWPVAALIGTGLALWGFYAYSQTRPPIGFGLFTHPPIYGLWLPTWNGWAVVAGLAGLVLAATGWLTTSRRRPLTSTALSLALIIGGGLLTAAAVALVRGDPTHLIRSVSTAQNVPYYTSDLHFVYELGVRGFVERHPDLVGSFHSYNSRTHPPGVQVLLYLLFTAFGNDHPLRITTALAGLSLAAAIPAWAMGRAIGGERAGRISAVLFVAAPGPLLLAYTSLDAVFATVLSAATAMFLLALHRRSVTLAAGAGAVIAAGSFLTYAVVFVVLAAVLATVAAAPTIRIALRLLAAAAGGGLVGLVVTRIAVGYDLLASFGAAPDTGRAYNAYWIFASPAAWLIWAGLPLAALGLVGAARHLRRRDATILLPALILVMIAWATLPPDVTNLRPGEVERTWAFLYPVLAAAAGPVVARWSERARRPGAIIATLVVISVAQTILLQALWDNLQ